MNCGIYFYFHSTLGYALCPSLQPQHSENSSLWGQGGEASLEDLDLHGLTDGPKECPKILASPISTPHLSI